MGKLKQIRELWGIRIFRMQVYIALLITMLTTPLAYKAAEAINNPGTTIIARGLVADAAEKMKSTAFFIENESPW